jgi:hypothetical protein
LLLLLLFFWVGEGRGLMFRSFSLLPDAVENPASWFGNFSSFSESFPNTTTTRWLEGQDLSLPTQVCAIQIFTCLVFIMDKHTSFRRAQDMMLNFPFSQKQKSTIALKTHAQIRIYTLRPTHTRYPNPPLDSTPARSNPTAHCSPSRRGTSSARRQTPSAWGTYPR